MDEREHRANEHEKSIEQREAYEYWGYLFKPDKTGTDKLKSLLRGLKNLMVCSLPDDANTMEYNADFCRMKDTNIPTTQTLRRTSWLISTATSTAITISYSWERRMRASHLSTRV